jgi:hypothetical protein
VDTKVLFDVATKPFPRLLIWSCLGGLGIGCLALFLARVPWPHSDRVMKFFAYFFCVSSLVTLGYYSTYWYKQRWENIQYLSGGRYQVVKGAVEDFHPQPPDGRSDESFSISGHTFFYSDYVESWITTCFNQTALRNGPIRPGMVLRIKFVNNCILEIEQLPETSPSPQAGKSPPPMNSSATEDNGR